MSVTVIPGWLAKILSIVGELFTGFAYFVTQFCGILGYTLVDLCFGAGTIGLIISKPLVFEIPIIAHVTINNFVIGFFVSAATSAIQIVYWNNKTSGHKMSRVEEWMAPAIIIADTGLDLAFFTYLVYGKLNDLVLPIGEKFSLIYALGAILIIYICANGERALVMVRRSMKATAEQYDEMKKKLEPEFEAS